MRVYDTKLVVAFRLERRRRSQVGIGPSVRSRLGSSPKHLLYPLPKVMTELVVRLTGGGKPLNEDLTALCHSQ
jgi:hypothetical protein